MREMDYGEILCSTWGLDLEGFLEGDGHPSMGKFSNFGVNGL